MASLQGACTPTTPLSFSLDSTQAPLHRLRTPQCVLFASERLIEVIEGRIALQDVYIRMGPHSDDFYRTFLLAAGSSTQVGAPETLGEPGGAVAATIRSILSGLS